MSFMFNPFPYDDPNAVNRLDDYTLCGKQAFSGNNAIGLALREQVKNHTRNGRCVVGLDGYATAPFDAILSLFEPLAPTVFDLRDRYKDASLLEETIAEYLPMDREKDPVLLYGKLFKGEFSELFDEGKIDRLFDEVKAASGVIIVYGNGALSAQFKDLYDLRLFADVTPKQAVLNIKNGSYRNLGSDKDIPFKATMRRCYYVDFEICFRNRHALLQSRGFDFHVDATHPDRMNMLAVDVLFELFEKGLERPLRCRPVYLEGVWGGYLVQKERNLPKEMKNAAWIFDLIPMEVSVVFDVDGVEYEFPYYTLVHAEGEKLMGKACMEQFGGYFPIRFNYDDTFHSNGNMSIQLHPGEKFLRENSNEPGRQDESYYIVETAQGARTFVGFCDDADPDEFIREAKRSEKDHQPVDYLKYINYVESKPGIQVMIPAGTIHASGRNQLILEIGSLTVGSYTYKMYDYCRKDLDGNPRPIHSYYGELNIDKTRNREWVMDNIVQQRRHVRGGGEGDGFYEEVIVGEHDLLYFSLRNLIFNNTIPENTDGYFHVLSLVDGEDVTVRSKAHPEKCFRMKYLDIIVVPASVGEYEIVNNKPGSVVTIHKTMLKH